MLSLTGGTWVDTLGFYILGSGIGLILVLSFKFVLRRRKDLTLIDVSEEDLERLSRLSFKGGWYVPGVQEVINDLFKRKGSEALGLLEDQNLTSRDIHYLYVQCGGDLDTLYEVLSKGQASKLLSSVPGSSFYQTAEKS